MIVITAMFRTDNNHTYSLMDPMCVQQNTFEKAVDMFRYYTTLCPEGTLKDFKMVALSCCTNFRQIYFSSKVIRRNYTMKLLPVASSLFLPPLLPVNWSCCKIPTALDPRP